MTRYRDTVTCDARRRAYPDDPCIREAEHRGHHRDRRGATWPNGWQPQRRTYVRLSLRQLREQEAERAAYDASLASDSES